MVFVFQATSQDMTKVSSNMGSTLKRLVTFLQFGGHRHCGSRDISFSFSRDCAKPRDQKAM